MKRNILHTLWAAAVVLLTACQQEELPLPGADNAAPLAITITDGGYASTASPDDMQKAVTRATENGYRTKFTAGDKCGLYIVRSGTVVRENVKLTATAGTNGSLTWQPETDIAGGLPDESYFLYYPYQANMTGKFNATATTGDADFFAPLINDWQPEDDQSDYAAYTASDLMTATGTGTAVRNGNMRQLTFAMTHRMALAVIEMPKTVYKFTDTSIPDYTAPTAADFTTEAKPYRNSDCTYRYIVNPKQPASLTGSYDDGKKEFTLIPSGIAASDYKTYKVNGATVEKEYTLQVGDYLCKKSDGNWYIIPYAEIPNNECIGIVFYAGRHEKDYSDYTTPLTENGPMLAEGTVHGYAVALTDVHNISRDHLYWEYGPNGVSDQRVNVSTDNSDWSGYANCLKIHDFVKTNTDKGWKMQHFPAALACETYGNRTIDNDGNTITDGRYDWQQPFIAPDNSSGWFLPSCDQLYYLYQNRTFLTERINAVKNKTGDTALKNNIRWFAKGWYYWSSTESSVYTNRAWYVDLDYDTQRANDKDGTHNVRAVLAF